MERQPVVSVCCVAFNHEAYIATALDSFLMQKTNFPYEILVHDDASTDRTPEILRDYEARYPGLITVVYQTENQYSKGKRVSQFILEKARGKYVAACEGDDFWTDPDKLQLQVDYMESHPGTSLCVHGASHVDPDGGALKSETRPATESRIFTTEEVIEGGGSLFSTNSSMYPVRYATGRPDYYHQAHIGDYPLAIYLATQGDVYYIDRKMSAYRVGAPGSWTKDLLASRQKMRDHFLKTNALLDAINEETEHQYQAAIRNTQKNNRFLLLLLEEQFQEVTSEAYRDCYEKLKAEDKVKIFLKSRFPGMVTLLRSAKGKWQR